MALLCRHYRCLPDFVEALHSTYPFIYFIYFFLGVACGWFDHD